MTPPLINDQDSRAKIIRNAALVALIGNFVLAVAKITAGIISGSLAVVGDGIDTSVDVLIAGLTLFVSGVISRPADPEHPWGHGRAETIATAGLSFLLFFAGFQLVTSSAGNLLSGKTIEAPEPLALIITLVSIAGKLLLALNQYKFGKKSGSEMLIANSKNMAADVMLSVGVLVGIGFAIILNIGFIDSVAALLVGFWVIKNAVGIFLDVNAELMDGGVISREYKDLFEAVNSVKGAGNPHRARMRRIAGFWDIDIDIEVDGYMSVYEAHEIATDVECAIRKKLELVFDIMVHIEPAGGRDNYINEGYGLNEKDLS
ncbi:cation transporter [Spirochaetia bacterium]|nr:cation transporter [Spirochaetia bacterium]